MLMAVKLGVQRKQQALKVGFNGGVLLSWALRHAAEHSPQIGTERIGDMQRHMRIGTRGCNQTHMPWCTVFTVPPHPLPAPPQQWTLSVQHCRTTTLSGTPPPSHGAAHCCTPRPPSCFRTCDQVSFTPILEVAQSMMIPVSETPLFLLPTMTWPKVMEVLEGATEHKMGSIPVVDNAYDLRLLGSVPVDSLRFAKNTMEYHTCEAKRLRESTKYTVQISPPASVEGGKYTISLNLGTQVGLSLSPSPPPPEVKGLRGAGG